MQREPPLDDVYTTDDWYDGPLAGFASYRGLPRYYRAMDAPHGEHFELIPVTDATLRIGIEADDIFRRWSAARRDGSVSWVHGDMASFGALPEERARYTELRAMLAPYADQWYPGIHVARAEFTHDSSQVRWVDVPDPPAV